MLVNIRFKGFEFIGIKTDDTHTFTPINRYTFKPIFPKIKVFSLITKFLANKISD